MSDVRPRETTVGPHSYAVADYGAHVTRWAPGNFGELLYLSSTARFTEGQAIRGGVPICFPWFADGPAADRAPAHGFARRTRWRCRSYAVQETTGLLQAEYELRQDDLDDAGRESFPFAFTALYDVVLAPAHARFTLRVTNHDDRPFAVEAALHTYLRVGDIAAVRIDGLDGADYVDKTAGQVTRTQSGPVLLGEEVDRIYESTADVIVRDEDRGHVVRVRGLGAPHTVVWNPGQQKAEATADLGPGEWRQFVCVESAVTGDGAVTLSPGARHELEQQIFVTGA
ncbi:D-hexose-6-phosphate mutarotase [Blastococcus sp. Marseille-P5729]|uniref:D-hexose-6-phosphate mutarotase n=1 Tax=Blastococcus sp. Marseille-P5729 TaxID=2086582 RepID=UPI00131B881B|nr:D-hexose-6-phosphate mutarotase [Blastococcus sp. Marseille-P5729]